MGKKPTFEQQVMQMSDEERKAQIAKIKEEIHEQLNHNYSWSEQAIMGSVQFKVKRIMLIARYLYGKDTTEFEAFKQETYAMSPHYHKLTPEEKEQKKMCSGYTETLDDGVSYRKIGGYCNRKAKRFDRSYDD